MSTSSRIHALVTSILLIIVINTQLLPNAYYRNLFTSPYVSETNNKHILLSAAQYHNNCENIIFNTHYSMAICQLNYAACMFGTNGYWVSDYHIYTQYYMFQDDTVSNNNNQQSINAHPSYIVEPYSASILYEVTNHTDTLQLMYSNHTDIEYIQTYDNHNISVASYLYDRSIDLSFLYHRVIVIIGDSIDRYGVLDTCGLWRDSSIDTTAVDCKHNWHRYNDSTENMRWENYGDSSVYLSKYNFTIIHMHHFGVLSKLTPTGGFEYTPSTSQVIQYYTVRALHERNLSIDDVSLVVMQSNLWDVLDKWDSRIDMTGGNVQATWINLAVNEMIHPVINTFTAAHTGIVYRTAPTTIAKHIPSPSVNNLNSAGRMLSERYSMYLWDYALQSPSYEPATYRTDDVHSLPQVSYNYMNMLLSILKSHLNNMEQFNQR